VTLTKTYLFCPYEQKEVAKSYGARWDSEKKQWYFKGNNFPDGLKQFLTDDADESKRIADEVEKNERERVTLSSATDSDLDIPKPDGLQYMPFQRAGIEYASKLNSCLIADEMGLGKTIQAIGLINLKNLKDVLIVCPKSVKINWQRELEKWLTPKRTVTVINNAPGSIVKHDIVIINYDMVIKFEDWLIERQWDIIIVDESARLKNPKAKRSKVMKKILHHSDRKLFLTGTPILNRPVELYSQLDMLGSQLGKNWYHFVTTYCDAYQDKFGWRVNGATNLEELQIKLRTELMIRRTKADVLTDLPPKARQIIELTGKYTTEINNERNYRKSYLANKREIKREMRRWKEENETKYKDAVQRLKGIELTNIAEISKLRHQIALAKLPEAIEHIDEILENENKILVFAHHRDIIEVLQNHYHENSVVIYGGTTEGDRQKAIDKFQNDSKVNVFIGSITAAGIGITLTAASVVVFVELDWTPANISQCEDRAHRIGQKKMVLVHHLVVPRSLDGKMVKMLVRKQNILDRTLDKNKLLGVES